MEGLIWYSNYNDRDDCTNYGISYTLGALLGFGIADVKGCKINPAIAYANGVPNNPSKIEVRDLDSSTQNNKAAGRRIFGMGGRQTMPPPDTFLKLHSRHESRTGKRPA